MPKYGTYGDKAPALGSHALSRALSPVGMIYVIHTVYIPQDLTG